MSNQALVYVILVAVGVGSAGAAAVYISHLMNQRGIVTGILYVMEDSSAIVDGQLVRNGDVISGVRIVSIEKGTIEFQKNGIRWKQGIREKPNPAWNEPR